jgi:hypothetical protein
MQGEYAHGPPPITLRRDSSEYEKLKLQLF